jgi:hypothetical protein
MDCGPLNRCYLLIIRLISKLWARSTKCVNLSLPAIHPPSCAAAEPRETGPASDQHQHEQPVRQGRDPTFASGVAAFPARTSRASCHLRYTDTGPSAQTTGRIRISGSHVLHTPAAPTRPTPSGRPPDSPAASSPRASPTSIPPTTTPENRALAGRLEGRRERILMAGSQNGASAGAICGAAKRQGLEAILRGSQEAAASNRTTPSSRLWE